MDNQLSRLGDAGRSPMQNQNPYVAPTEHSRGGGRTESWLTPFRFCALAFAAIVTLNALHSFSLSIQAVLASDTINILQHAWPVLVIAFGLVATGLFFLFVEFGAQRRGMRYLPIPLVLLVVLTLFIVRGFFSTVSSHFFSLTWIFQNPHALLSWLMCPIVWCYSMLCFTRHHAIRKKVNGEQVML